MRDVRVLHRTATGRLHEITPGPEWLGRPPIANRRTRKHAGDGHRSRFEWARRERRELQLWRASLTKCPPKRPPQDFVHQGLFKESHLGFRRVDVHVDAI